MQEIAAALLKILTDPATWDEMSANGVRNIHAYSWPAHCRRVLEEVETEKRLVRAQKVRRIFTAVKTM
jgi:glycosyltransferase involved in cell wall biosynthesis